MSEVRARKQEQEPARPDVIEVAPGVLRAQLPIAMPGLGHVNTYLLPDERGAAVVDPGLPGPLTWRTLRERLAQAGLRVRDVHTVIVTHSHPDHFGAAGKLAKEAGAELVAHRDFCLPWEQPHAHADVSVEDLATDMPPAAGDEPEPPPAVPPAAAGRSPWGSTAFRPPFARRVLFRAMRRLGVMVNPRPTHPVSDGEPLRLAGREWFAVHTPGHTLDHLCLHDPEEGLLLSGDHVLPTITPHIAGVGAGPDPLSDFIASLDRVVASFPDVRRVLPAHGHPFDDLAGRVGSIERHHRERLERLREVSRALGPATVAELSHEIFAPRSWGFMAESETYAHLEHLRLAGQAERYSRHGKLVYVVG